jgi:hypothetical protein
MKTLGSFDWRVPAAARTAVNIHISPLSSNKHKQIYAGPANPV